MQKKADNAEGFTNLKLVECEGQILTLEQYIRTLIFKTRQEEKRKMDKKIKKIKKKVQSDAKHEEQELEQLQKMDKKRDKACDLGKKILKEKKKK